jgi:zinc D-Ala-D-Ala carboxypeptidase
MSRMLSDHFSHKELECPCCQACSVSPDLISRLEALRMSLGVPLKINSGYRCEKHNARLKNSSPKSKHVLGEAVDIACTDPRLGFRLVRAAMHLGFGGIGVAKTFIHVDVRSPIAPAIWTY